MAKEQDMESSLVDSEKFRHERHWETQTLIDAFLGLKENTPTTYQELADICKISIAAVKKRMHSARNIALSAHNLVIDSVHGVGITRLSQDLVTAPVAKQRGKMRSAARRGIKLITKGVTDFAALPAATQSTLYVERALLGTVAYLTTPSSRKVLESHTSTTNAQLSIGRTLELLKRG